MKLTNSNGILGKLDAGEMIKANGEYGALQEVSRQLETQFLQSLLKQMRSASDALADEDSVFSSKNDGMYRDWYDAELSNHLSQVQSIGLAEVMTRQLSAGLNMPQEVVALEEYSEPTPAQPMTNAMQPALFAPFLTKEFKEI